ncbi:hypothetical protein ABZ800_00140 [Streptomyces sp. NPDC047813]|uniref:hypothetical protein n=1 Tax=Streptomyces sp. NPDC047813 TaxID=3154608 RepID=UPI0033D5948F
MTRDGRRESGTRRSRPNARHPAPHPASRTPPATAIRTTEAYVAAYFDHWLRGGDGRLLERPSPIYPAMEFVD